jgi:hypothetical protein
MGPLHYPRRAGAASVLLGLVAGAVFGLTACGLGDGGPSTRPSDRGSSPPVDRPSPGEPGGGADATGTSTARPTLSREPGRTEAPPETAASRSTSAAASSRPVPTTNSPTPAETKPTAETEPPAETAPPVALPPAATPTLATPTLSASPAAGAAESGGMGPWGWLLLIGLVAALVIGGLLLYRSQRKSAWDAEAGTLEAETRTLTATRLPLVLTATNAGQRALTWPPVRASLVDLIGRWNALTERASGETRRNWSLQIDGLLQELVAAVDAENDALALGQDWTLLRPRVNDATQALAAVLTTQPQPPPPAAEPGPPAFEI